MYRHALKALRESGIRLLYTIPDPRWVRLFKLFPMLQVGSFPLWSVALPLAASLPISPDYAVSPLVAYDERVERLWAVARHLHSCQLVRNTQFLPWKIGSGDYQVLAVERGGELVGLVAGRQKGDQQWLICDMLAADEDALRVTLAAAVNSGHGEALAAPPGRPIRKAAVLATPLIERAARPLGFQRDQYDFPMIVHLLDHALPKEQFAPERWYVSAND